MKILSNILHTDDIMEYNGNRINSKPITIPCKINKPMLYDTFTFAVPEYGSIEEPSIVRHSRPDKKSSESSDFPNIPFGKSPPATNYMKHIYLNFLANHSLAGNAIKS